MTAIKAITVSINGNFTLSVLSQPKHSMLRCIAHTIRARYSRHCYNNTNGKQSVAISFSLPKKKYESHCPISAVLRIETHGPVIQTLAPPGLVLNPLLTQALLRQHGSYDLYLVPDLVYLLRYYNVVKFL